MNRHAQITLFLIIGLFVLGSVGLVMFLVSSLDTSKSAEVEVASAQDSYATTLATLRNCLKRSAEDSLTTAFLQGGTFDTSGTALFSSDFVDNGHVSFGITSVAVASPTIPDRTPSNQNRKYDSLFDSDLATSVKNIGGVVTLRPLCDRNGANNALNQNRKFTCDAFLYGATNSSLQYLLQKDITQRMQTCVATSPNEITFPNISNVTFADTSVQIEQTISVVIPPLNGTIEKVAVEIPVRAKDLYTFLYYVLRADSSDPLFDKQVSYDIVAGCSYEGVGSCMRSGFVLQVHKGTQIDVVEVRDERSFLKGEPLRILTAVSNRRPLIDSVSEPSSFQSTRIQNDGLAGKYDIYRKYDASLSLEPKVYDFDEDQVVVRYSGWSANYTSTFDIQSLCLNPDSSNPSGCSYYGPSPPTIASFNEWEQSNPYVTTVLCSQTRLCSQKSFLPTDMGIHETTLFAIDERGAYDYYTARIVVGDE